MVNENDMKYKPQLNNDISESNRDADVKANIQLTATHNDIVVKNDVERDNNIVKGTYSSDSHGDQLSANSTTKETSAMEVNKTKILSHSGVNDLGDYTNIRATIGAVGVREEGFINKTTKDSAQEHCVAAGTVHSSNVQQHYQQQQQPHQSTQHTQASAFSFKHFLSNCNVLTAPSSTVTSLDYTNTNITNSTVNSTTVTTSKPLQTSTGARPKVPQSTSASSGSISSLIGGHSINGNLSSLTSSNTDKVNVTTISSSKMKRSPRFSSFDSQASLAEYVDTTNVHNNSHHTSASIVPGVTSSSPEYQLYSNERQTNDYETWDLPSTSVAAAAAAAAVQGNQGEYHLGQYVQRSYSNYDVTRPQTSPSRRYIHNHDTVKENRPTRLSLNMNCSTPINANMNKNCGDGGDGDNNGNTKLKLDLPLHKCSTNRSGSGANRMKNLSADFQYRANITNPNRPSADNQTAAQPPPGAASALPDFVQDHWMDSWYSYDMQLNSPNTSPVDEFFDETKGGDGSNETNAELDINVNRVGPSLNLENSSDNIDMPPSSGNNSVNHNAIMPEMNSTSVQNVTGGSKMLPDFLSDGPIIHSSQRLADIATGLPSNRIGSPQDSIITAELTRMREENERLKRDLTEIRMALCEQTRRANDLERQVIEYQKTRYKLDVNNRDNASAKDRLIEKDKVNERKKSPTDVGHNQQKKLKQQISKLTAELEALRREREREGAIGGCNVSSCDYSTTKTSMTSTPTAPAASASDTSSVKVSSSIRNSGNGIRLSRSQQLARQLVTAAANAEGNLRQLLAGVDNLRQMAANIEHSNIHFECLDASPDLFSEFRDECDDDDDHYDKFNSDKFNL